MNPNVRESLVGGRNFPALSRHRQGQSLTEISKETDDENLDLFSRNRRTLSVTSSDESSDGTGLPLHTQFPYLSHCLCSMPNTKSNGG